MILRYSLVITIISLSFTAFGFQSLQVSKNAHNNIPKHYYLCNQIHGFSRSFIETGSTSKNIALFDRATSCCNNHYNLLHEKYLLVCFATSINNNIDKSENSTDVNNADIENNQNDDELFDKGSDGYNDNIEESAHITEFDTDHLEYLPRGIGAGFYVVKLYEIPNQPFDMTTICNVVGESDMKRLELTSTNISLPIALMVFDKDEYPSQSKSRKACRKGNILVHRGPAADNDDETLCFSKLEKGRVGHRVHPGDVIAKQIRMGKGNFKPVYYKKPSFDLPVVYEDDYFAIVNKPAGVPVYSHKGGGYGTMAVRAALPFAIQPPQAGTYAVLRRPQPVHRIDKPTSGLLLIAKTKPAMVNLSTQFSDRTIKKTYSAIVNGVLPEPNETMITSQHASDMGVDVNPNSNNEKWQVIDEPLDEKHAVTVWRTLKSARSLKANNNTLTLVELKPKTGRFHQLRRHLAWVYGRPIVGDSKYDGGGEAMQLRDRGLFLCSNRVILEHPFYNTEKGRKVYDQLCEEERTGNKNKNNNLWISSDTNKVMVTAEISLPEKFSNLMEREDNRFQTLSSASSSSSTTTTLNIEED